MKSLAELLDLIVFGSLTQRVKGSLRAPDKASVDAFLKSGLAADPESFYQKPQSIPPITESMTLVKQRPSYDVYDVHFPSAIASPWIENNTVYGRFYKTKRAPSAPTIVVLHGWLVFSYAWFSKICRKLAEAGINGLIIQLPYHMNRQPPGSRYSGEYSINGELMRSIEMIRQAVSDTRSVVNWVKATPTSPIGIWGISLGGWIGGILAAVEPRLDVAVLMIPAIRPDDVIWYSKLCPAFRAVASSAGITYEQLHEALKIVTPTYFRPCLPPDRILLMEAEWDLAVRPHTIEELWEAWGHPRLLRYPHSHISIVFSARALEDGVSFIRSTLQNDPSASIR
jgi:pimeloyl-ACP methyl ester carboxylesterase